MLYKEVFYCHDIIPQRGTVSYTAWISSIRRPFWLPKSRYVQFFWMCQRHRSQVCTET